MAASLVAVTSHGLFGAGGSGTCDYPSQDDVRDGVEYAFAAATGNMTLPDATDVLEGVSYGTNGTEFNGSLICPQPPTPVAPAVGSSPFTAIAYSIVNRLAVSLGISTAYIRPVANDRYKVTETEPVFCYVQFFTPGAPRDPGLNYTDSGAGRHMRPIGRRVRVYVYTRQGVDSYGGDEVALFGTDPSATIDTTLGSTDMPGHFLVEELVYNSLDDWMPLSGDDEPLLLTPIHVIDASEEPFRPAEDEEGLVRSCLDFEVVYISAISPTEPPD